MRLENDTVLNELFDEQFEKIPFLFRFSRRRFYASLVIMGVLLVSIVVFICLFYNSGNYEMIDTAAGSGYQMGVNVYNNNFAVGVILSALVLALISFWVVVSKWFEQRAFKKASNLAQMIHIAEENRNHMRWMNWKAQNRFDF